MALSQTLLVLRLDESHPCVRTTGGHHASGLGIAVDVFDLGVSQGCIVVLAVVVLDGVKVDVGKSTCES